MILEPFPVEVHQRCLVVPENFLNVVAFLGSGVDIQLLLRPYVLLALHEWLSRCALLPQ
jgi:hypothetical protein